jgi:hypothetical protein
MGLLLGICEGKRSQVDDFQRIAGCRVDELPGFAIDYSECRVPDLVPLHHLIKGRTEGVRVESTVLSNRERFVVNGVRWNQLTEIPELFLAN